MKIFYKISATVLGMAAGIALVQPQIAAGLSDREVGEVAQEITVRIDGPKNGSGAIVRKEGNKLSPAEINAIARQTTVAIAPGLTPELAKEFENNRNNPLARSNDSDGLWNPSSGVIIAREGKKYYVLTVSHSFKQRHLDENMSYGIRTSDGRVHVVKGINDGRGCPLNGKPSVGKLIRFGCYSINVPQRVTGVDLAVVSFDSDRDYMVASLGNNDDLNTGDNVYISGWPDPEKEKDPRTGKCRGRVARRQWRLVSSTVVAKIENLRETEFGWGYGIFYLDKTQPGMAGGPVFDANGRVVSIHGRGSGEKQNLVRQYCAVPENRLSTELQSEDIENILAEAAEDTPTNLHQGFSSGQSMNVFLSLLVRAGINLPLRR